MKTKAGEFYLLNFLPFPFRLSAVVACSSGSFESHVPDRHSGDAASPLNAGN